jgi:hypothetical protein
MLVLSPVGVVGKKTHRRGEFSQRLPGHNLAPLPFQPLCGGHYSASPPRERCLSLAVYFSAWVRIGKGCRVASATAEWASTKYTAKFIMPLRG